LFKETLLEDDAQYLKEIAQLTVFLHDLETGEIHNVGSAFVHM